jgi:hypothetical protein
MTSVEVDTVGSTHSPVAVVADMSPLLGNFADRPIGQKSQVAVRRTSGFSVTRKPDLSLLHLPDC